MKTRAVLVITMLLVSGLILAMPGASAPAPEPTVTGDSDSLEPDFTPEPMAGSMNDPMVLLMNARIANRGPFYLDFHQIERGPAAVASVLHGEDYAKVFRFPHYGGQKLAAKHDSKLDAKLDIYINSMDQPGKIVRFKVEIDRNGDGINDTTIDFPSYETIKSNEPERVVMPGTVFMQPITGYESNDLSKARVFLKVWRDDDIDDLHYRLKVYCGFLSDTEMGLESKLILPWINPVPHVAIDAPLDKNATGRFYYNNEQIFFDGRTSSDPTGEALSFVWTFSDLRYRPIYDKEAFNLSFKDPGWYTITLNVSNSLYFTNQTSVTIYIAYKNHPPDLDVMLKGTTGLFEQVPDYITTYTYVPQEWLAVVEDPDGDNVTIYWNFDDNRNYTTFQLNHSYRHPHDMIYMFDLDGVKYYNHLFRGLVQEELVAGFAENDVPLTEGSSISMNLWDDSWTIDDEENGNVFTIKFVEADMNLRVYNSTKQYYRLFCEAFDGNETSGRVNRTILVSVEPNKAPIGIIEVSGAPYQPLPSTGRGDEIRINLGDTIRFEASKSYDPDGLLIKRYKWDFDDVYATEDNPTVLYGIQSTHKFLVEGEYNVSLNIYDGVKYGTTNLWVRTNNAPIAVPPGSIHAEVDDMLTFDASRSNDPDWEDTLLYKWDFGDNIRTEWSESPAAEHPYSITATYTGTLYVTDGLLQSSATFKAFIESRNHPPEAQIGLDPNLDENDLWTNMSIQLTSAGSYDPDANDRINYVWNFGDGSDLSQEQNPEYLYKDAGTYTVTLQVIDNKGLVDTDDMVITVQRNYGDNGIVLKALEHNSKDTFYDPPPEGGEVAVVRNGWIAYVMDLKDGYEVRVKIVVTGDKAADIYLFQETHFTTYKTHDEITFVPFVAVGYQQGLKGEFIYTLKAKDTGRYYIVVDNKNAPQGTETEGPVDYTIEIDPKWETEGGLPGPSSIAALAALGIVAAVAVTSRSRRR